MSQEIVLVGREGSGKSTVAGGLIKYITLERNKKRSGDYEVKTGSKTDFEENIINNMNNKLKYPAQTQTGYTVQISIPDYQSKLLPREENLSIFDLGGEHQSTIFGSKSDIIEISNLNNLGELNIEPLHRMIENNREISDRMNEQTNMQINYGRLNSYPPQQQKIIVEYIESLIDSYGILFLLNLKKLQTVGLEYAPRPQELDTQLVRKKQKKALVVTGCDCIDYDPDPSNPDVQIKFFDKSMYDNELYDKIKKRFQHPRIISVLGTVDKLEDFDLFGVSVPQAAQDQLDGKGSKKLMKKDSEHPNQDNTFVTKGFETLVRWINK